MRPVTAALIRDQLELAEQLRQGRETMLEPQDLPGRYGRAVRAVDRVLQATGGVAVVGGGWAVWRHGYVGRVTQDLDVALAAALVEEFLRVAVVSGFEALPRRPGRWPKLLHKETGIQVDLLPEGERPGTSARPAPTLIPHPTRMGAAGHALRFIDLTSLIELKLAAGRAKDTADVVELLRANPDQVDSLRHHLAGVHADYVRAFDEALTQAREQDDA
jgi:hypothetical protein